MPTHVKELWKVDPSHSEIQFKVKHLVISTVTGSFTSYTGEVEANGDDFENAVVTFNADIDSISTNDEKRDNHLKSADFFDAEAFPKLTFESTLFEQIGDGEYRVKGNMTIRDKTEEVILNAVHGGTVKDHLGNTKAGFEINGVINRKKFGLTLDPVTEAGTVVVSDKIKLQMNVQLGKN